MDIILTNREDLEEWATRVSWLNRADIDMVRVSLPWLSDGEQQRASKVLKRHFNDCGCAWGAPALVLTFAWTFISAFRTDGFSWTALGMALLTGACAAVAGKLLGLAWSHWRLAVWFARLAEKKNRSQTKNCSNSAGGDGNAHPPPEAGHGRPS